MAQDNEADEQAGGFSAAEHEAIEERTRPSTPVIYETLRREGDEELDRPVSALWWSGLAAGLSLSFSVIAEAMLQSHLPDAPWRPLVARSGYAVGFLIAVLGRQQLFTENTLTPVLTVMADFNAANLGKIARLWGIVLIANLAGALIAALFCSLSPALPDDVLKAVREISAEAISPGPATLFWRAIPAGFVIAAMVWLLPPSGEAAFFVIIVMTYIIAASGFAHVIVGASEAFFAAIAGRITWPEAFTGYIAPTLAGNVVGGTGLFALLSYGQVAQEIEEKQKS
ncbi:MAG TPA: formate/nitrite transporter family protein [Caulobacteraceae bacterium]|jgi:formate/nitrite transporter FocA (FNT family)|nr:formate/nitrite transporter family protein [Caulobacteraceae bacterium]